VKTQPRQVTTLFALTTNWADSDERSHPHTALHMASNHRLDTVLYRFQQQYSFLI